MSNYDASSIEVLEGLEAVRKRPGMYIGGTDERALHHLVAEILDNSMDEAVAGHASQIDVELNADGSVTIRDDGRGIPVDPHPKFPGKSALEVILCTLHAGGKFDGDAYETSGGLHGVGASVVNALSSRMTVRVARDGLWEQSFSRGVPIGQPEKVGSGRGRRGTEVTFMPDADIFHGKQFTPHRIYRLAKSKAFLRPGVSITWKTAIPEENVPLTETFHYADGLAGYLKEEMGTAGTYLTEAFSGSAGFAERFGQKGKVEWAVNWTPSRDGFSRSWCNTVPTPEGGTHESGFWAAILKGVREHGERISNRKAKLVTREDLGAGACALVSCFLREPEFVGQTKDRLASAEAARMVETVVKDRFDGWLGGHAREAAALIDYFVLRAEERLKRKEEKETARKSATKKLRLPGKLVDCATPSAEGTELFLVEGDSAGGSAKAARNRMTQGVLPLRGKVLNVLGQSGAKLSSNVELNDLCQALGVSMGSRFDLSAMRYERVIIMTDADVDGSHISTLLMTFFFTQMRPLVNAGRLYLACPPLYRLTQGPRRLYVSDDAAKEAALQKGLGGRGPISVQRFKGLGEMDAKDLKETTMDPASRRLIRVDLDPDYMGETEDLVERLMGKDPAQRFAFIQANASFAEDLDV